MYADIYGNIGIRPTGKVPIRDDSGIPTTHAGNGSMPYNGSAGQGEWIGYVSFDDLPHSENPDQNYLVSANQIVAGPEYLQDHSLQSGYANGYRARRIHSLLADKEKLSVEDMQAIQLDVYSTKAGNMTPHLLDVLDQTDDLTELEISAQSLLESWDHIMDTETVAGTIFKAWMEIYRDLIFRDELEYWDLEGFGGFISDALVEYLTNDDASAEWFDDISTSIVETRDDIILEAFQVAIDELTTYFLSEEPSDWIWGSIHQNQFEHLAGLAAFRAGPFEAPGTSHTVNPSYGSIWRNGEIQMVTNRGGASERMVLDFSNLGNSVSVVPSGQRGVPGSKHYIDQLIMFNDGLYHTNYFGITKSEDFTAAWIDSTIIIHGGAN